MRGNSGPNAHVISLWSMLPEPFQKTVLFRKQEIMKNRCLPIQIKVFIKVSELDAVLLTISLAPHLQFKKVGRQCEHVCAYAHIFFNCQVKMRVFLVRYRCTTCLKMCLIHFYLQPISSKYNNYSVVATGQPKSKLGFSILVDKSSALGIILKTEYIVFTLFL